MLLQLVTIGLKTFVILIIINIVIIIIILFAYTT